MSVDEAAVQLVERFLQPLPDESAPCGPDLEYDNAFLELNQAAAGRAESQWDAGEPPNWGAVRNQAEALFERTRDLRVAVLWLRAMVSLQGLAMLQPGLQLVHGLLDTFWDTLHPLPDPDDGDAYARLNALAVLREADGLLGDLRQAVVFSQRGAGELRVRDIEVALNLMPPRADETPLSRSQIEQMLQAAVAADPALHARVAGAATQVKALIALLNDKVGIENATDLKPLWSAVNNVLNLIPAPAESGAGEAAVADEVAAGDGGTAGSGAAPRRAAPGLSGSVNSREEAVRAIDMVCEYLERAEPTSPAPLLLRRARRLVNRNFLQLMKELAPDALSEVARVMGVDPETVQLDDAG